jgi:hypothetical protein
VERPHTASVPSSAPPLVLEEQPPAVATPHETVATALRNLDNTEDPQLRTATPAQDITVRISHPDSAAVDVQLSERAGRVRVDVRTPDAALQTNLRQDLGALVKTLESSGYRTEAFVPSDAPRTATGQQLLYTHQAEAGAGNYQDRDGRRQNPRDQQQQRRKRIPGGKIDSLETAA